MRLHTAAVGPAVVFKVDNVRSYRDHIIDEYLESERIARMDWPALSSNVNPIVNPWDALNRAASAHFPSK